MNSQEKRRLEIEACKIRMGIIESTYGAKAGHPGGALSSADLIAYLYNKEMNVDPKNPKWEDRDRFVLSKGHSAPALYAALANRGFFPLEDLPTLRHIDSYLQGHPNMNTVPGVDMSTGSLGQGISAAVGMAKAAKLLNKDLHVYALLGDGELAEGEVWEAMMFANHYQLDNLTVIVDNNGLQIDGKVEDVMSPYSIIEKFKAFGLIGCEINGHDMEQIDMAFEGCKGIKFHPQIIVMKTTKGKGVSYMENQVGWHGKAPNDEEYAQAMQELKAKMAELEAQA